MNCKDAIDILGDYLESALSEDVGAELEAHLQACAPCRAYLATYRRTRDVAGKAGRVEMPEEMKQHLRDFLLAQLGRARNPERS